MLGAFWTERSVKRNRLTQAYEPLQPFLLLELAARIDCKLFVDIGANIGFYSILFSLSRQVEEVHAFEPSSAAFNELESNLQMNGLKNAHAYQIAASNKTGSARLLIREELAGVNALDSTTTHEESFFSEAESVKTRTLDDLFDWSGKSIAIKIDVEGHEENVIQGGKQLLTQNTCILQVECLNNTFEKINKILREIGYNKIFRIKNDIYFTNSSVYTDEVKVKMFEKATSKLIQSNLGRWPEQTAKKHSLSVSVHRSGSLIHVECTPDSRYFEGETEFAFYLRKDGKKESVIWYSKSSEATFEIPENEWNRYSISAFCRDRNHIEKKIMITRKVS